MDDILLPTHLPSRLTRDLFQLVLVPRCCVSVKKAQLCQTEVLSLGYKLSQGKKALNSSAQKEAILHIPMPQTKKQVCKFFGAVEYCQLWILGLAEIVRPLLSHD